MKTPKQPAHKRRQTGVIALAATVVVIIAGLSIWGFGFHRTSQSLQPQPTPSTSPQQSVQPSQPPTAGGQPIPQQFWSKARRLGYYCPSWNAKPGQMAPDICTKLDN